MERFLRFAFVGGFATLFQYALLITGVHLELGPVTVVSGAAFAISAVFNFLATRIFTFQSREPIGTTFLRFSVMVVMGISVNTLVMWLLVSAGLHYLLAQIAATVIVLFWNYVVALRWVFTDAGSR